MAEYKYWAFISYSHQDRKWGDWLHKSLETFRVPRRLVGRDGREEKIPRRVHPVFRDREELPTSSDLGASLRDALEASRYLIVVCSPASARSRWVDEEIRAFKAVGRENRILCLIVSGEPNASDKDPDAEHECFPPALRFKVTPDGELTQERVEAIAADLRARRDTKRDVKLKLVAGLIGVGFDELKLRDRRRSIRRWSQVGVGVVALLVGGVLLNARWQKEASRQRVLAQIEEAKGLLERAASYQNSGNFFAAAMMAARTIGFEGYGREAAGAKLELEYPVLLGEHTAAMDRQRAQALVADATARVGFPIWQSPVTRNHTGRVSSVAWSPGASWPQARKTAR